MTKSDHSSFRITGIWVMLRYLALPIMLATAVYAFGGPGFRVKVHSRLYAAVQPFHERIAQITGNSEMLQARMHVRDPDLHGVAVVRLGDLPVAAEVPVVQLSDLPLLDGPGHVKLSDLPPPIEDSVVFLQTRPDAPLAIARSPRPRTRPAP